MALDAAENIGMAYWRSNVVNRAKKKKTKNEKRQHQKQHVRAMARAPQKKKKNVYGIENSGDDIKRNESDAA